MSSAIIIDLDDDDDEVQAAPRNAHAAAGSAADAPVELLDDDDDDSVAAKPAATGKVDAPVELLDDDDPAERRRAVEKLAAAACTLCQATRFSTEAFTLSDCHHRFCLTCIREYVERKLKRNLASEVGCPTCSKTMTIADVQTLSASSDGSRPRTSAPPVGSSMVPGLPPHLAAMFMQQHGMDTLSGGGPNKRARVGGGGPSSSAASSSGGFGRAAGTAAATKRLMKELQSIRKADTSTQGFEASLPASDTHAT